MSVGGTSSLLLWPLPPTISGSSNSRAPPFLGPKLGSPVWVLRWFHVVLLGFSCT